MANFLRRWEYSHTIVTGPEAPDRGSRSDLGQDTPVTTTSETGQDHGAAHRRPRRRTPPRPAGAGGHDLDLAVGGRGEDPLGSRLAQAQGAVLALKGLQAALEIQDTPDALQVDAVLAQGLDAPQPFDVAV